MIVISSSLVMSESDLTPDHPIIGYRNIVTIDNIVADGEDPDYPVTNLANPATHLRWKSDAADLQYLTITTGSADPIDYVGIAKHNFGTAEIAVSIEGDDGGGYPNEIGYCWATNDAQPKNSTGHGLTEFDMQIAGIV